MITLQWILIYRVIVNYELYCFLFLNVDELLLHKDHKLMFPAAETVHIVFIIFLSVSNVWAYALPPLFFIISLSLSLSL